MAMLNELGFNPIVLHEQASGGLTIAEKLEKYAGKIGYAFIILTPDDIGAPVGELEQAFSNIEKTFDTIQAIQRELSRTFKRRARQNVVLEFGYLMGRLSREKICCLYKGDIELPSDMHGICYVHFNNSVNEVKDMVLKELKEVGYEIKN
jgi:predicted nucleotide-binding protein